ncbi:sodium-dependent transporter [Sansalvadorimonas sp. 2012CJ34-2]|uniref:Sodium-dependent transporter n=1 Tax=Parendozoicomonas callyspongiae TaxID=2942213 RepID=A0ABT0PLC8_9GAMM|nr:sodium-dependent transporter [Sansalvadorimonas sp. 2012CJ34-2]MCL6272187.1 sodium-dependent transporter [Sansalvadorimonas sp. 2012CJ34-2]
MTQAQATCTADPDFIASSERQGFSSRLGFVLAAAGSAVGLGNIWGFPTQVAQNGGAAFILMYLVMVAILAYPMLVAELTIGRMSKKNPMDALMSLSDKPHWKLIGKISGVTGILVVSLILSFYGIVSGWLMAFMGEPVARLAGMDGFADWLVGFSVSRNLITMAVFMVLTVLIVRSGVTDGVERWSKRLMPSLFILLMALAGYIATLPGAEEGLRMYFVPDLSKIFDPSLMVSAMGQAFFSLSLGTCAIMAYGSYLSQEENISSIAGMVAGLDTGVAILAGILIIPAMTIAQANGVEIYAADGSLLSSDALVFSVLPSLFHSMGDLGEYVAFAFFTLLTIAALTSSISMLEAPVNTACEKLNQPRGRMALLVGASIALISTIIILNFGALFGFVITLTTVYAQPMLALVFGLLLMWVASRNKVLQELKSGNPDMEQGLFWKIWPWYVKFVCPVLMLAVFLG